MRHAQEGRLQNLMLSTRVLWVRKKGGGGCCMMRWEGCQATCTLTR